MNDFFRDKQGNPLYLVGLQAHNSSTGTDMLDRAIRAVQLYGCLLYTSMCARFPTMLAAVARASGPLTGFAMRKRRRTISAME